MTAILRDLRVKWQALENRQEALGAFLLSKGRILDYVSRKTWKTRGQAGLIDLCNSRPYPEFDNGSTPG
jgi:hypothetical protein